MGFRVGFYRTLLRMGAFRFGVGYSTRGATGLIMLCMFGLMNLMWYMVLGCLWITYGIIWLVFVLPVKVIKKIRATKKMEKEITTKKGAV